MAVFGKAQQTIQSSIDRATALKTRADDVKSLLEELDTALQISRRIETALQSIEGAAASIETAVRRLRKLLKVPGIHARVVRALIATCEGALRVIRRASRSLRRKLDHAQGRIDSARPPIRQAKRTLGAISASLDGAISRLNRLLSAARVLEQQQEFIEDLLGDEYVAQLRAVLGAVDELNSELEDVENELEQLEQQVRPTVDEVRRIIDAVNDFAGQVEQFAEHAEEIKEAVDTAGETIEGLVNGVPEDYRRAIEAVLEWLGQTADDIAQAVTDLWEHIKTLLSQEQVDAIEDALDSISNAADTAQQSISDGLDALEDLAENAITPLGLELDEVARLLTELETIAQQLRDHLDSVNEAVERLKEKIGKLETYLILPAVIKIILESLIWVTGERVSQQTKLIMEELSNDRPGEAERAAIAATLARYEYAMSRVWLMSSSEPSEVVRSFVRARPDQLESRRRHTRLPSHVVEMLAPAERLVSKMRERFDKVQFALNRFARDAENREAWRGEAYDALNDMAKMSDQLSAIDIGVPIARLDDEAATEIADGLL